MAETTKTTLPKDIFDVKVTNHELLKVAYNAYLANGRSATAKTKTRGDVRGGVPGRVPQRANHHQRRHHDDISVSVGRGVRHIRRLRRVLRCRRKSDLLLVGHRIVTSAVNRR